MTHEPTFTATRAETESHRLDRLQRVWGYATALAELDANTEFPQKVSRLHDHKGNLTVRWFSKATDAEKQYFVRAWKSSIGDKGGGVDHDTI